MLTMSVTPNITIVSNDEKLTYRWNENLVIIVQSNTEVFSVAGKCLGSTSIITVIVISEHSPGPTTNGILCLIVLLEYINILNLTCTI